MAPLDGTEKITATPFDAHEQVARASHEHTADGLVAKEYEHQEYPKAVDHVEGKDGQLEPVVAKDADHEAELLEGKE